MKKCVPLLSTFVLSLFLLACGSGGAGSPSSNAATSGTTSGTSSGGSTTTTTTTTTPTPPPPPPPADTLQSVNHIIFMLQENRSFDNYFGQLNAYRATLGLSADADDLAHPSVPLVANPTHDGSTCANSPTGTCTPFKMASACIEDLSPSWNESHVDLTDNLSSKVQMNGFAYEAGGYAANQVPALLDVAGQRAMGYYDATQLNYYYFMATQFGTSDRFFSPMLAKSEPNHLYSFAATSQGYIGVPTAQLTAPTIFNLLQTAGISWKVYYTDINKSTGKPDTYASYFSKLNNYTANFVPLSQYFTDLQNGTLPAVALIEAGRDSGLDEHPDNNVVVGAQQVEKILNALMSSTSYASSVFILTWDEGGGMYDHVPPASAVNPDGIAPNLATDPSVLTTFGDNFTLTGFRLPLIVVSPWAKKGYISHRPADYTSILKFIETRFNLPSLTLRDAAQPDMTDFFDFANVPNATPPVPPVQVTNLPCYLNKLP